MVNIEKAKDVSTLMSGCFVNLINGSIYLWGTLTVYVTSYYRLKQNPELTSATSGILFAVATAVQAFVMPFSIPICKKVTFRGSFIICGVIFTSCILICSAMENFWAFFFFYAIIFNIFSGLVYMAPVFVVCKLFPGSKGLATGIIMSSFGIASSISGIYVSKIINPDGIHPKIPEGANEKLFPEEVALKLPSTLRYLAIYFGFLTFLTAITYLRKGLEKDETLYQAAHHSEHHEHHDEVEHEQMNEIHTQEDGHSAHREELHDGQGSHKNFSQIDSERGNPNGLHQKSQRQRIIADLKSPEFRMIIGMMSFSMSYCMYTTANYKVYGLKYISDDEYLTIVGSIGLVFNGIARVTFGRVFDYLSFRKIYWFILGLLIFTCATMPFIVENQVLYFIYICVGFVGLGGHFSVFSVLTIKVFGLEDGSKVYGFVFFAVPTANFLQFGFNKLATDSFDNYNNVFWLFLACLFISLAISFRFKGH